MTNAEDDLGQADDEQADLDAACQLSGREYEALVAGLVRELARNSQLASSEIHSGSTNRVPGASGYRHQIDLSVLDRARGRLFIVEAKCWKEVVGVDAVLVLASRKADIGAFDPTVQVRASIVSTQRVTRGATQLAKYLGIGVDTVQSEAEFGLTFADQHFVGIVERLHLADEVSAGVARRCSGCGEQFTVKANESRCASCAAAP
jgi:hypothetical protein